MMLVYNVKYCCHVIAILLKHALLSNEVLGKILQPYLALRRNIVTIIILS